MYEQFFGLREKPFELLPNPNFLYPSKVHKKALAYLEYGLRERSGFILLTGEVGAGKTTIIRDLLKKDLRKTVLSKVFNTRVDSTQLVSMINDDFGLEVEGRDKVTMLRELTEFLIDQFAAGNRAVLIIDEAQNLSEELLEEVRMLSNLETDNAKLLQIILVGQPELKATLNSVSLRQLRQRILVQCHLTPLSEEEVQEYVLYRLERAGNREAIDWSRDAFREIYETTQGVPRLVNILCDYLLLDAFSVERRQVTGEQVADVVSEMEFRQQFFPDTDETADVAGDLSTAGTGQVEDTGAGGVKAARGTGEEFEGWNDSGRHAPSRSREVAHKMMKMLRDMQQRIEILEATSSKVNEGDIFELGERMQRLEQHLEESFRQVGRLSLVVPQLEARLHEERLAMREEPEPAEDRGWLSRVFGG